jgi:hypothetical protein
MVDKHIAVNVPAETEWPLSVADPLRYAGYSAAKRSRRCNLTLHKPRRQTTRHLDERHKNAERNIRRPCRVQFLSSTAAGGLADGCALAVIGDRSKRNTCHCAIAQSASMATPKWWKSQLGIMAGYAGSSSYRSISLAWAQRRKKAGT